MPRPVWNGTISFGLVAIPIKLYHGVSKKSVSFNQLDERTMSRIRLKKVSAETGEDVPDEHIIKGYELSKGRYVVVDPIAPRTSAYGDLHAAGHPPHGAPHASQELWRRHDLATPVYPYGWFGARPANSRSTRGSYYEDYENVTIFRGR